MKIIQYVVIYRYNAGEPQQEEICYTPAAARAFAANVELWGGVYIINEVDVEEGDINGIH